MTKTLFSREKLFNLAVLSIITTTNAAAQSGGDFSDDSSAFWYIAAFVITLAIGGGALWWLRTNRQKQAASEAILKSVAESGKSPLEAGAVDAGKEMEWYRKNQKAMGKRDTKNYPRNLPQTSNVLKKKDTAAPAAMSKDAQTEMISIERQALRERMMRVQFAQLPIGTYTELKPSKPFDQLPISSDVDLLGAIEQANEEFEEDETVRDLALRILSAFKTRNSIEALSQIALYDISANLRSKAVTVLADFDHESVFETILQACADPSREVRAAAARGLFRLSFDRADAWTRIAETNDEFRMRQAARAAIGADLVQRSFERLIHDDLKITYEAFALTVLLIKAGETKELFETIENHRDNNVKLALIHVLNQIKDEATLSGLYSLLENDSLAPELRLKVDETIKSFEMVHA